MKFKQYINEIKMSTSTEIRVVTHTGQEYMAIIALEDGLEFELVAQKDRPGTVFDNPSILGLSNANSRALSLGASWEISFYDDHGRDEIAPKRKGAALELFAALEKIIKDFVQDYNPEIFYFTAKSSESSRIKLYNFLAKKIKGKSGYKLISSNAKMPDGKYKFFIFYK